MIHSGITAYSKLLVFQSIVAYFCQHVVIEIKMFYAYCALVLCEYFDKIDAKKMPCI